MLGAVTADVLVVPTPDGWSVLAADVVEVIEHKSLDPTPTPGHRPSHAAKRAPRSVPSPAPASFVIWPPRSWPRSRWVGRPGAWRPRRPTPRSASSSVGRSASSRPSSTAAPTCSAPLEQARAVAWDAAAGRRRGPRSRRRPWPSPARSRPMPSPRAPRTASRCYGGIGFTWEHDAHLYLRRAMALRQLLGGEAAVARAGRGAGRGGGARRSMTVDLPAGGRGRTGAEVAGLPRRPPRPSPADEWDATLADAGYLVPHWPAAVGPRRRRRRAARHRRGAPAGPGPSPPPPGRARGCCRRSSPTARRASRSAGSARPCAARSPGASCSASPSAGSDLASLTTRAEQVDGGWSAQRARRCGRRWPQIADWGICLARTEPRRPQAPRHHATSSST